MTLLVEPDEHATIEVAEPAPSALGSWRQKKQGPATAKREIDTASAISLGILLALTLLTVWSLLFTVYFSRIQEHRSQHLLYTQFRSSLAAETAPLGGVVAPGTPVALATIAKAGISNAVIVEGTTSKDMAQGIGHLSTSVLPGQAGLCVLYGRSVLFGAPFSRITSLRAGNAITFVTQQGTSRYVVDRIRQPGDPVVPLSAGASRLVLATSEGDGWRSGWAPSHVVYVDASLVTKATVPLGGQPTALADSEKAMASDSEDLVLVVVGLQGLLLVSIAAIVGATRWSRMQTFVAALPVVFALLWYTSDAAAYLLPNLL